MAVLSTKRQLDEAVKEINDVRQLAIQEGSTAIGGRARGRNFCFRGATRDGLG